MPSLHLLVRIGDERAALPATTIDSVVTLGTVTPVPRAAPPVIGLAALRSRVVTVIDVRAAVGLPPAPPRHAVPAVIVALDGQCYGLVVDAVEDVVTAGPPLPLAAPPGAGWARAAGGLIAHDGALLLLLDPAALIAPCPLATAA